MSLKSWIEEFYPKSADSVNDMKEAIKHSITKWEGLHPDSLARHNCVRKDNYIMEAGPTPDFPFHPKVHINSSTCALCQISYGFNSTERNADDRGCADCPLYKVRGNVACDNTRENEKESPWDDWLLNSKPHAMLIWLYAAEAKYGNS